MKVCTIPRFRILLSVLAATLGLLLTSGCSGGWGALTPTIGIQQGQSQTVSAGQSATFSVTATGTGPFTYQWYLNGSPINGATSSSYTTGPTASSQNGSVYTVTITNAGGSTVSAPYVLNVNTAPVITTQPTSQTITVGQAATFMVTASGTAPLAYQWYQQSAALDGETSNSYTTPATTTLGNADYFVIVSNMAGTVTSATAELTVAPLIPTLVFASIPAETYGNPAFAVSATSASNGAVTYAVVSGPATISGSTVTLTGVGSVILSATQAASGNYAAATTTTTFNITTEVPTLVFAAIPAETYGNPAFPITATSASNGAVTYAVASGPATISGSTVTLTGVGPVILSATQAASGNYAAATTTTTFNIATEVPTLVFASIPTKTFGNPAFAVSATSASSGAVTYAVASGPATISGSTVTLTGAGTVILSATQAASGNYAAATTTTTFNIATEVPTVVFASIPAETYGNPAFAVSATSASSGAVTYTVASGPATLSGSTVTLTGVGTVILSATQAASGNYAAATTTTTFTVATEVPTLVFAAIPTKIYGNPAFAVSATSASSGAVTYAVVSGPATLSGFTVTLTGVGTVILSATQAASGNYAAASTTTIFTVTLPVTITPVTPANQTMGPGSQTFSATASSGSVTWTASGGTITSGGAWTSPNVAGTYTITATSVNEPSISVSTTATVSRPVIILQPTSKNACSTYSPSLSIAANYATSYEWTMNGSSVATGPTITFTNATTADSGNYTCTAINAAGSTSSNTVTLNVVSPTTLTITTQPSSVSVYATQTATFSVAATGTGTLTYQWYTGTVGSGTAISGATSSTYTTAALTSTNNGTTYYVTVTDPDCTGTTVTSNAATLTVSTTDTAVPPTIVVQPTGQTATVGGTATFSVTASGSGTLTYQWYRVAYSSTQLANPTTGASISGATSSTYTVPSGHTAQSDDGDTYYVVVTNAYGSAVSNRAVLAVGAGIVLQITAEPQTEYVGANTLASFSTTATCTGCIPAYQWYAYAPGSGTATALSNGAVSSGPLSGVTVAGATTSSLTLQNVPTTSSGATFYVVVTSTSDGTSQITGTNPLTSTTAGLFVGSLGTVGNTTPGDGLCNNGTSGLNWVLNGNNPGTSSGDVPYQNTSACTIELVNNGGNEHAAVYWPTLISTANFSVSFTVALTSSGTPADGFTMVLADPSQGATTTSLGITGYGLGADGIPGFVLGFDTFQNGNGQGSPGCTTMNGSTTVPCDPLPVPYMAVGQGATSLWENPWTFVNGYLNTQNSSDYSPSAFANATHSYVVTVVNRIMTVTIDGHELFTGTVSLPPAAYLGFTASTGGSEEAVTVSSLTATISAP